MAFRMLPSTLLTYILVILFGSSSWISVNGTWIQLPLMVNFLPEKWALPSYLAIIVQIAFIGPLIYAIFKKLFPYMSKRYKFLETFSKKCEEASITVPLIYSTLVVAVLCHLLLAIFWKKTTEWANGAEHSTTLFVLFFFLSVVNSLSNILYLPYMFRFRPTYTTAYFIGMGFSALVPSVLGLIQGSGRIDCVEKPVNNSTTATEMVQTPVPPLFSVGVFNGLLCVWLTVVVVGFYFLNRLPQGQEAVKKPSADDVILPIADEVEDQTAPDTEDRRLNQNAPRETPDSTIENPPKKADTLPTASYIYYLLITAWVCALMNGVLPSIQTFATLPYGQLTYHLAVTISNLANPVACFVPFFIKLRRASLVVSIWTLIGTLLSIYILMAASWSPKALLGRGSAAVGPSFSIISWTLVTGILAYLRTVIAGVFRESGGSDARSENRLFWCGLFTQAGAFIGAVVMFPLINVQEVFISASGCVN